MYIKKKFGMADNKIKYFTRLIAFIHITIQTGGQIGTACVPPCEGLLCRDPHFGNYEEYYLITNFYSTQSLSAVEITKVYDNLKM